MYRKGIRKEVSRIRRIKGGIINAYLIENYYENT
jgi:hypothetical protein